MDISIVRQARETLAGALAASQEAGESPAADALAGQIAQAVGALFQLENDGSGSPETRVAKALASIAEIAEALPRMRLPPSIQDRIQQATADSRRLLDSAIRPASPVRAPSLSPEPAFAETLPAPAAAGPPTPATTPAPRPRMSSAPPAVRRTGDQVEVETEVDFMTETNFFVGFAGDLSDGGLFIATWQTLPVGSTVTITFTLPDGHRSSARGQVMWVREVDEAAPDAAPGMGVTLEGLSDVDMKSVGSFMSKRAPIFHPG